MSLKPASPNILTAVSASGSCAAGSAIRTPFAAASARQSSYIRMTGCCKAQ